MSKILAGLNIKQQEAVAAPLGNLLILAGAGSGKTRVLVNRIAWLMENYHLKQSEILAVTFTNKAAAEMKTRLSSLLNIPLTGLWVGTFHGLCHRLLRIHHQEANLTPNFQIVDHDDQLRLLKRIIKALNLDENKWPAKLAQAFINSQKEEGLRADHVSILPYGPTRTLVKIYKVYEETCNNLYMVDFAELLLRTVLLIRDNNTIQQYYHRRFQAILVDEFQDTNTLQYAWIRLLSTPRTAVLAVGDDDQSIYGWRGAKIENIHQFSEHFHNAKIIRLEQNYRSTANILAAANALITNNQTRMGKNLWTEANAGAKIKIYSAFNDLEEARFVINAILKEINANPNAQIAVLYRSNAQSRLLEETLMRAGISYRIYGGLRFFERAEIKDLLAYLRLIVNPHDDNALERIINFPVRGIGAKTIEFMRTLVSEKKLSMWEAATILIEESMAKAENSLSSRATSALNSFIDLINSLKDKVANLPLEEQINTTLAASGLKTHYAKFKGEQAESRVQNLQELINAAQQFRLEQEDLIDEPLLTHFLAHTVLGLDVNEARQDNIEDQEQKESVKYSVNLMTLHAAKGLEFPIVFLVGMEEGVFPAKQALESPARLEEERRLCYVGITRAMEKLFLTSAEVRRQYGRDEYQRTSRFLRELPVELTAN